MFDKLVKQKLIELCKIKQSSIDKIVVNIFYRNLFATAFSLSGLFDFLVVSNF